MCVIPLIIEGPDRTVVKRRDQFETAGGLNGNVLLIQGLEQSQFLPNEDTNVRYDLRVGQEYRDHRDDSRKLLPEDGEITLLPGGAVIVKTEERIQLPKTMFGHIIPRVTQLQLGISNTSSKVDPGYGGNLLITIFNLGKRTVRLKRKDKFCSIYFLQVREGARLYTKAQKDIETGVKKRPWNRIRDKLEANTALIMILLIIATLFLTIAQFVRG